jgi:HEAT repeat protein
MTLSAQAAQYRNDLLALAGNAADPQPRRTAVKALAFSQDHASVPVLVRALAQRDDARLVTSATFALARLADPSTPTEPLMTLVRDADSNVRSNTLLALSRVFDAKTKAGGSALDPIQAKEAVPVLEMALFDPQDPIVRANAAQALGALGDPRGVDPLINLMRDPHPLVRTKTAIALGKLGDLKAVPALVKAIDDTPEGTPRNSVILGLTLLLEKHGAMPPASLGDSGRVWETYVRETMGSLAPAK